ncbi:hypothetical protein LIER_01302 [Lithospermum erythrorhizon]|uniref:Retrovirus-related Pol polyprotein from transposon TNT 1-94-like beta-barrel domain-containing protein n=1 Tax=Lithospermum erythrorhizon TaxID=34254 RepID=A0AAV3NLL3_LITER
MNLTFDDEIQGLWLLDTLPNSWRLLGHQNVNLSCDEMDWVVDSGGSTHATSRHDLFSSYETGDFGVVRMENNGQASVIRIGDICVKTSNGTPLVLKGVKHIPDFRFNLLSIGKLDNEGYENSFSGDE